MGYLYFYICDMLNLGLIGDIQLLDAFIQKAQKHREVHITGKSSVGTPSKPGHTRYSVPEFNRIELIERSDVLLINRFSLLPFDLLCDMVKKSKHFFATSYPELTSNECNQIAKLAEEAQTIIQVTNPFYYTPAIQWLNANVKQPSLIEVSHFSDEQPADDILVGLILMLKNSAGTTPKKINAVSFRSAPADSEINSIQMEFGNGTRVNICYGKMSTESEFRIKTFANNQFTDFDFIRNQYFCNNIPLDLSELEEKEETNDFLNSIILKKQNTTNIEDYSAVIQTVQRIKSKLDHFSGN
ncbi:Predicted dehydrogenase [Mariniphaga anaerophila]|uniref:Predicted dehydrogenase n=1 Tax=Mariniphaga anaerophila TaxID=1484053 RepID=A0A1M5DJL4_9BACT|nr:hypothetical protein [Mariniphaga anaerophila]SHF66942.1 Predicted dehydrogenase [Mariniphaga anaerophila]